MNRLSLAGRTEEDAKASILKAFSSHAGLLTRTALPFAKRMGPQALSSGLSPVPALQVTAERRPPPFRFLSSLRTHDLAFALPRSHSDSFTECLLPAGHCSRPQGFSGEPPKTPGGQGRGGRRAFGGEQNRESGELGKGKDAVLADRRLSGSETPLSDGCPSPRAGARKGAKTHGACFGDSDLL